MNGLCACTALNFGPSAWYFQKINAGNINHMAVLDFLKMP